MNPFEPARLSPIPKTLVASPLPYDLTWADIRSSLPGFDDRENANAQAFASYEKQGLNGGPNSCILTLHYPIGENQFRSETVFIKQTIDTEKMEAQKYQILAALGIPTPRLLAAIQKDNAEIILLEFLSKIGIDFRLTGEVKSLLYLVAQLNSIQNPPDVFNSSPVVPQGEFDERVRNALLEISHNPSLSVTVDVPRWFDAYQRARAACKSMPLAVNHNEFFFQQVGWAQRDDTSQLVIFDLETMCLSPRFNDIAGVLDRLALYTGQDRLELLRIYLDRMWELNRLEMEIDEALHEIRLVHLKGTFDSLPWHVDIARRPRLNETLDNPLLRSANSLQADLIELGLL